MVQLSTDDVFDGLAQKPYTEFDNTNPKTVYGKIQVRRGELCEGVYPQALYHPKQLGLRKGK